MASAITPSTGLRRRERRFESCRGHHRGTTLDLHVWLSVTASDKAGRTLVEWFVERTHPRTAPQLKRQTVQRARRRPLRRKLLVNAACLAGPAVRLRLFEARFDRF